ncbi:hypothetical protein QM012_000206 [Aureobasidium pullulans]|uniref:Protein kinase domain-containing protein n=1 Tax=Aureobasidium pullulans TaxID=5580 RepID=A0ABR0TV62_AURPU
MRISQILLADGERVSADSVIGTGIDGYVIRTGPSSVMKIPKLEATIHPNGFLEPNKDNTWLVESLRVEKEVYQRLEGASGIAKCLQITTNGVELEDYRNGDLEDYIKNKPPPPLNQRLEWILQLLSFVQVCHVNKVLWFDIALRNLLLADDMSLRAIDFANSTAAPTDADLKTTEWDGYTARTEVLHVTNVIYSIARWEKFQVDCAYETEWPAPDSFPTTHDLRLGEVISKAWRHQYDSISDLRSAILSAASLQRTSVYQNPVLIGCALACTTMLIMQLFSRPRKY